MQKKCQNAKKLSKNCHFPKHCQKSRPRFSAGTAVYIRTRVILLGQVGKTDVAMRQILSLGWFYVTCCTILGIFIVFDGHTALMTRQYFSISTSVDIGVQHSHETIPRKNMKNM